MSVFLLWQEFIGHNLTFSQHLPRLFSLSRIVSVKMEENMAKATIENGNWIIPDNMEVPFIEGDGIGPDIAKATKMVISAAIAKAYAGKRSIEWIDILAGERAFNETGEWLPDETVQAIKEYRIAIKGPLTTPVGEGIRSLNVTLRQVLDLYACVRPVRWFEGVPAPVKSPQEMDVVIFRENTEDVYAGIEYKAETKEANQVIEYLKDNYQANIRENSGIGIKPMSAFGTKRLVKMAIEYAIKNDRKSVTLVHKGNIMKFTEGAFRNWGYEAAKEFFPEKTISENELWDKYAGDLPAGKVLVKDRIADAMFQQLLLRPSEYDVIACPNLNGDYLSDACAAQVGGLGLAPGANIGDQYALFEATHGTAPKYADKNVINPSSLILSAVMMLEHLGWTEAAQLVVNGLEGAIKNKQVTYDLERQMDGATKVSTSGFAEEIVKNF